MATGGMKAGGFYVENHAEGSPSGQPALLSSPKNLPHQSQKLAQSSALPLRSAMRRNKDYKQRLDMTEEELDGDPVDDAPEEGDGNEVHVTTDEETRRMETLAMQVLLGDDGRDMLELGEEDGASVDSATQRDEVNVQHRESSKRKPSSPHKSPSKEQQRHKHESHARRTKRKKRTTVSSYDLLAHQGGETNNSTRLPYRTTSAERSQASQQLQAQQPPKSLMDRFHTEFITSLHTLQKPKPLGNTSILFYDEKVHEKEKEQRIQQINARRRQMETKRRLQGLEEKKEKQWRKWLKDTMRAASPKRKSYRQRSSSSLLQHHSHSQANDRSSRLRTAPARVDQQRARSLQEYAVHEPMSASMNHFGESVRVGATAEISDMIPTTHQRALTSMSMNSLNTTQYRSSSKYERKRRPNTEKTYEQQRAKFKKTKTKRDKALDTWYDSLMTNIQEKYRAEEQSGNDGGANDNFDASHAADNSNWRKHREKEIFAKSFHFDSAERNSGGYAWHPNELTSW
eukprot:CAMPEP_0117443738 /NCGR_PEP_ID=MMETSP0759-20121206/4858_1 /TAXON_ID=63605 /ORGANISM="Percolomonas cosmopolitus, Strain WS" /LENGTH=513 /DNA_ID=CAMNT_0005235739 /DNA_START=270 /DNA_END=1811 /DNA_ORIENTATION=-